MIPTPIPFPFRIPLGHTKQFNKYLQRTYYCVRPCDWTLQDIKRLQLLSSWSLQSSEVKIEKKYVHDV